MRFLGVYLEENSHLPYLVMEYVDITLANYLQKHGVPEATVYYNILSDTVLGLCYTHHQIPPIIHRDLSANNVFLSSSMQAKISDLGVAKVLDISPTEKTHITQTQAPETDSYMPPEALVDRPTYDTSIDVFCICGTHFKHCLLIGQFPLQPRGSTQRMQRVFFQ